MAAIVKSVIRADTRAKGQAGLVIGRHIFDDGQEWDAVFECLADEDPEKRMADMIPQREADRVASDARKAALAVEESARTKIDAYVKELPDETLADAGLTPEEIGTVKPVAEIAAEAISK